MDKGKTRFWNSDATRTQKVLKFRFSSIETPYLRDFQCVTLSSNPDQNKEGSQNASLLLFYL